MDRCAIDIDGNGDWHVFDHEFVDGLQSRGRYTFTRPDALQALKTTDVALTFALNRLSK